MSVLPEAWHLCCSASVPEETKVTMPKKPLAEKQRRTAIPPPETEGLNTLDRERAASIADEGGASAATVEAQPPAPPASGAVRDVAARRRPLK
jgi:hypothetical protein